MSTRHVVYMGVGELTPAETNPKMHDLPSLVASLHRYGFTEPALLDERTGRLVAGHGRREALLWIMEHGEAMPIGVHVDDDGTWLMPVLRGWASRNDTEANAYIVAANQLTTAGGWHMKSLAQLLEDVVTDDAGLLDTLGYTPEALDDLLRRIDPETLNAATDNLTGGGAESGWDERSTTSTTPAADPDPYADPDAERERTQRKITCPGCGFGFEVPR